jgi:hypothetical protein
MKIQTKREDVYEKKTFCNAAIRLAFGKRKRVPNGQAL